MAGSSWPGSESILRGLFGSIVGSAEAGQTTSEVWGQLRNASETWAAPALRIQLGREPTQEEVSAAGRQLLSNVSVADVSRFRGYAGAQVRAHRNLLALGEGRQITDSEIFTPPWSKTAANPAIQPRYRIRVNWNVEFHGFTTIEREEWATYDLEGPLTTIEDAISQARAAFGAGAYNARARISTINDYMIEQV